MPSAPDWLMNATRPASGTTCAKVALRLRPGRTKPRQLGPTRRTPYDSAMADDLVLELLAGGADLLEAGRDDDGAAYAGLAALAHDVGHDLGGHGDDGEVDLARDLRDRRVGLDALHRQSRAVDGVDDAVVFGADQVAQQDVADRALRVRGADDGDALGIEELVQVPCAHVSSPRASLQHLARSTINKTGDGCARHGAGGEGQPRRRRDSPPQEDHSP